MAEKPLDLEPAINRGLHYLATHQLANGGFRSYSSKSLQRFNGGFTYETAFIPSLILGALSEVKDELAQGVSKKLAVFLKRQQAPSGSFGYWARHSKEAAEFPYPDDWDDTSCAWIGLYLYDRQMVDEEILAKLVRLLLACQQRPGGPYRTWLVSDSAAVIWQDVDLAVNANINYLLNLMARPLPNLTDFIDQAIESGPLASPYYPSLHPILYFLSRGYQGKHRRILKELVADNLNRTGNNDMQTALIITAASNLGLNKTASHLSLRRILKNQHTDGSWTAAAFCLDPARNSATYYNGAPALSTALIIEALIRQAKIEPTANAEFLGLQKEPDLKVSVLDLAEIRQQSLDPEVDKQLTDLLKSMANSSRGPEIINLALNFNNSLKKPLQDITIITRLSLANLYGWCAYTIYDDILDAEAKPRQLPLANIALRQSLDIFLELAQQPDVTRLVQQTFDEIDTANYWEINHCRWVVRGRRINVQKLPDYGDGQRLASRSLGHGLALLMIGQVAGQISRGELAHLSSFIRDYLIVRQLNDDLHDWQQDLRAGHLSYVVTALLPELRLSKGWHDLPELIKSAQPLFWNRTLTVVLNDMTRHLNMAQRSLDKLTIFSDNKSLQKMINQLRGCIADTRRQQAGAQRFLKAYRSPIAAT